MTLHWMSVDYLIHPYWMCKDLNNEQLLFSCSVALDSLWPHGREACQASLYPSPRVCSDSCPLSQWCHPSISSCCPLLLLPSIFPRIRVFSNEPTLWIRWPKYWSFSFSISPSNEYSGLISFRIDWFDLLAVQGTLKSLLQHRGSKASILRRSAFFVVQPWQRAPGVCSLEHGSYATVQSL